MLHVIDLSFGFGEKPLYTGVNFRVSKGQKVGLVGPNGSGKSTLFSIIKGEENGFTGSVKINATVGLVPQEIKYDAIMENSKTVRNYVDSENKLIDFEIIKMFKGLELNISLDHNPITLSGGQKTKLALARALFQNPDLLLLDEPTNFMDKEGKDWVMRFLANYKGAIIVISHDLELMDQSIDKILAVTPYNSTIVEYKGTYSDYIRLKKQKEENLRKELEIKSRHLKRTEERYNNSRAVATKSILRKKMERERENLPEVPPGIRKISIRLPEPKRIGEVPLKTSSIKKSYEDLEVLKGVDFTILRGEKIALIGSNGTGKSTFIKILMDITKPDGGEIYRNSDLSVGYYSQEFETFDFKNSVIEAFTDFTKMNEGMARGFLARFMLSGQKVFQRVGSLSGGEKTRLSIACLTGKDNNLLILDEPTTYLDVMSQRIILESLKEYKGTMIIVSHSPEFMKELKPDKAYLFPEHRMVYWDNELIDRIGEV
ncbi:MAG: ABC transporter related protein [Candidatus Woesebacteria bacterium GW2011_GWA1_33_30]|uniref:ABC transporter related protein n=1 Tax=Candidatus Woesebacteria bacterium GW2011_GWA2_33_28 TaxID=1618561 RepID=A0A0G0C9Y3_9BACT|nr:MAG: ABC transporter related protein [Candidatus Woesebacteria bacterium GW2011_GWA2_33_28]KKP48808.1 MAG: ABC transporter related protein [Candidatus Woesebacteria bacterium GW2011_GWA1_33_30]KKP50081.1 MAG: ABC transporter related protein [Microgenomates group bacterium GW2011_GWC1_33_32]KKP51852.1 MAG: ABC transporter related protein [Candidatus Woesebacteria bacterium GW2011_GWB1_33_38]KKP57689.1 MAG: ABC transporter related protein [Microgenomates group bacterium GW2011_GWD1_33_9]